MGLLGSHRAQANDPVIASARRTPIGRRGGMLAEVHPHDLLATAQDMAIADAGLHPTDIDMIVTGCVTQIGAQAYNIGRMAALASGVPDHVPAMTLDAQCGSSHQALNVAAAMVKSGTFDVVVASGVEAMSQIPLGSAQQEVFGTPYSKGYLERYDVVTQGESAERIADKWAVSRAECDQWAARSQLRGIRATEAGRFAAEIAPVAPAELGDQPLVLDEGLRPSDELTLAALKPAFRPDGRHTAGNSSQISDGAAAVVVMSAARAARTGVRPLARIVGQAFVGVDPVDKLTGPIPATAAVLETAGLTVDDIDNFEVSEAFAAVVVAWLKETGAAPERVNVNGGAIALGHPVGASGARMITTAAHQFTGAATELSLVTMCCGGGLGTATLLAAV